MLCLGFLHLYLCMCICVIHKYNWPQVQPGTICLHQSEFPQPQKKKPILQMGIRDLRHQKNRSQTAGPRDLETRHQRHRRSEAEWRDTAEEWRVWAPPGVGLSCHTYACHDREQDPYFTHLKPLVKQPKNSGKNSVFYEIWDILGCASKTKALWGAWVA